MQPQPVAALPDFARLQPHLNLRCSSWPPQDTSILHSGHWAFKGGAASGLFPLPEKAKQKTTYIKQLRNHLAAQPVSWAHRFFLLCVSLFSCSFVIDKSSLYGKDSGRLVIVCVAAVPPREALFALELCLRAVPVHCFAF